MSDRDDKYCEQCGYNAADEHAGATVRRYGNRIGSIMICGYIQGFVASLLVLMGPAKLAEFLYILADKYAAKVPNDIETTIKSAVNRVSREKR